MVLLRESRAAADIVRKRVAYAESMRISYEWTQDEWNEAVRLALEPARRRGSLPGITYALVLVPLTGGLLEFLVSMRQESHVPLSETTLPMLLGLIAICAVAWLAGAAWKRGRRRAAQPPMPMGAYEVLLQEDGWSFGATPSVRASALRNTGSSSRHEMSSRHKRPVASLADSLLAGVLPRVVAAEDASSSLGFCNGLAATATAGYTPSADLSAERPAAAGLSPWSDLSSCRKGRRMVILLHANGFAAVPVRCLSEDQAAHLQRMLTRKLKPAAVPVRKPAASPR